MLDKRLAIATLAGGVVGAVGGYVLATEMNPLPRISIIPEGNLTVGQAYEFVCENFPPNTQLISARNSTVSGGDLVNLGTTDANGKLVVPSTAVAAGLWYLNAFDAPTGKYAAVYTVSVI